MSNGDHRITVAVVQANKPIRDWNFGRSPALHIAYLDSLQSLKFAVNIAVEESSPLDLGRIIVDRSASADDLLDFLAAVPSAFTGDIVFIRDDDTGFLSASGRGGDRVIYQLYANDVRFYLETHDLVTGRVAAAQGTLKILEATA